MLIIADNLHVMNAEIARAVEAMEPEPFTPAITGAEHLGKFAFKNRCGIIKHREMLAMILSP